MGRLSKIAKLVQGYIRLTNFFRNLNFNDKYIMSVLNH